MDMTDRTPGLGAALTRRLAPLFRSFGRRRARWSPDAVLRAAHATMARKRTCVLGTRSEAGVDARVLQPHPPGEDLSVRLGTCPRSRKAAQLAQQPEVIDFRRWVTPEPFGLCAAALVRSEQGWVAA